MKLVVFLVVLDHLGAVPVGAIPLGAIPLGAIPVIIPKGIRYQVNNHCRIIDYMGTIMFLDIFAKSKRLPTDLYERRVSHVSNQCDQI